MTVAPFDKNRLDIVAKSLGYKSAFDFTRIQLSHLLNQKMAYRQAIVDKLTAKYGMPFVEFRQRVVNPEDPGLARFGILEKEDDDMEWELAHNLIDEYTNELMTLV